MMYRLVSTAAIVTSLAVLAPQSVAGQEPRRAAVMTAKGDLVEGVFKGLTDTEAVIEIAGQTVRIPLADVRYVSFVGKIEVAGTVVPTLSPMEKAFASLKDLRTATQIGMLRDQYAQKLVETLPPVRAFVDAEEANWFDVRLALMSSLANYQRPLSSLEAWKGAGESMGFGGAYAEYAMKLASQPDESTHKEDPAELSITVGGEARGRLGFGDQIMAARLDRSTEGALNDVYNLIITEKQRITIEMACVPCLPHLTVALAGKAVEGDMGWNGKSTIRFDAIPNRYQIWAGTQKGSVGEYVLRITAGR